ncbi:hypothetical protein PDE_02908 [Penicillium oxalicum 114-2]|uniref:RING-type domain-containing protein n=1 Tax=Penicillium oxalicum (strain 114-2 / CGMCC 5302) TaxID=933388 RepID=S8APV1_PENO1|nr:hypothetical protein PDE_02908 [Penicillium oxalicum 114-2]
MAHISNSISSVATLFAGSGSAGEITSSVHENVGFRFVLDRTVRTLSANNVPISRQTTGLLFVPTLSPDDPCNEVLDAYIPETVIRLEDIVAYDYPYIGIAPWLSVECAQSFLAASRNADVDALIFFKIENKSTIPPGVDDESWSLNDHEQWKDENQYPVYAIPGLAAATLMHDLAWVSNIGTYPTHPDSEAISLIEKSDIKLFVMISNEKHSDSHVVRSGIIASSVVGAAVLVIIACAVLCRARCIRRRVGHTYTEGFGMRMMLRHTPPPLAAVVQQRLPSRTPPEIVHQIPLFSYDGADITPVMAVAKNEIGNEVVEIVNNLDLVDPSQADSRVVGIRIPPRARLIGPEPELRLASPTGYRQNHLEQDCVVCASSFDAGACVRELPCGHMFHQGCIDQWLLTRSHECPLCKRSVITTVLTSPSTEQNA